jgi:hypothetical protein
MINGIVRIGSRIIGSFRSSAAIRATASTCG